MSFMYPVQLNVINRDCLIVGAGKVALRKATMLLNAGAQVTVVAPTINEEIRTLVPKGLIVVERPFQSADVCGRFLVFAATDSREVNSAVAEYAKKKQILVNVADSRLESDFILPAVVQKEDLCLAISTNGINPGYAKLMKEYLATEIDESFLNALWVATKVRENLRNQVETQSEREQLLRQLDLNELIEMTKTTSLDEVVRKVTACLLS